MDPDDEPTRSVKVSKEDFEASFNRIALALAKRESLVKSWTASSSRPRPPEKTQAELDAEDAALFRNEPPHLGVGAAIPSQFLVGEAERNKKSLRNKLFPSSTLKSSKARDAEEKAASAKRGLKDESSDEEEGRSGLGKAKKRKTKASTESAKEPLKEPAKSKILGHLEHEQERKLPKPHTASTYHTFESEATVMPDRTQAKKELNILTRGTKEAEIETDDEGLTKIVSTTKGVSKSVPALLQRNEVTDPAELKRLRNREKKRKRKEREKLKAAGKV